MIKCALTTFDNPFDPIDQFDSWFLYDIEKGYNTCERLARFANTSDQLTEKENMDDFIKNSFENYCSTE